MAQAVYFLCALTSIVCAMLLHRGYRKSRARLLLWSSACFMCLAVSNVILILDMLVFPQLDLSVFRGGVTLAGLFVLVFGLIWETA
jgi:hypothetical protein